MLVIDREVRNEYKKDTPQLETTIDFFIGSSVVTVGSGSVVGNELTITESICSKELLSFNSTEINTIEFKLMSDSEVFSSNARLIDTHIHVKQTVLNKVVSLGKYIISDVSKDGDNFINIKANDYMAKFDVDVSKWWNTDTTFPINAITLLESLCSLCGVSCNLNAININRSRNVIKGIIVQNVKGLDFLGYFNELFCCFLKVNRDGVLVPIYLEKKALYPSETLLPSNSLLPSDTHHEKYPKSTQKSKLEIKDYVCQKPNKLIVRGSEKDIGVIVGTGTNAYIVENNPLLFFLYSPNDIRPHVEEMFSVLKNITYIPFKATLKGLPYIECGDYIELEMKDSMVDTFVLQRTFKGVKVLTDEFTSKGNEYITENKTVNKVIQTLNKRTLDITQEVDRLAFEMTQVENGVDRAFSEIEQTADEIRMEVSDGIDGLQSQITQQAGEIDFSISQFRYRNLIVNSDFDDIGTDGVPLNWSKGTNDFTIQPINDESFPNGKALRIISSDLTSLSGLSQSFELSGLKKHKFYVNIDFKINTTLYAGIIQSKVFVRYKNSTWGDVFSEESYTLNVNEYRRLQFTFNLDGTKEIEYLLVYTFSTTQTWWIGDFSIGRVFGTFDNPKPNVNIYNNYASNDIISQINMSPSGIRIKAEKIGIEGIVTFDDLSNTTGTTVINGGNIKTGTIEGITIKGTNFEFTQDSVLDFSSNQTLKMRFYNDSATYYSFSRDITILNYDGQLIKIFFKNGFIIGYALESGMTEGKPPFIPVPDGSTGATGNYVVGNKTFQMKNGVVKNIT